MVQLPLPVPLRPAASLILLRDHPRLEVLVGVRPAQARAFPGAVVCPGGKLDPHDHDPVWSQRLCPGAPEPAAAAVAALRETFEETGVLLAHTDGGGPPRLDHAALALGRAAVEAGTLRFADLLDRWGLVLDGAALVPFSRWITPLDRPHRFDTWFFLTVASDPTWPLSPTAEFARLEWREVDAVLAGPEPLMAPVWSNLARVAESATSDAAMAAARTVARAGTIQPVTPKNAGVD